jgi:hypothetical protein
MFHPDVKDLLCDGHSLGQAVRIVGAWEEYQHDYPARLGAAVAAQHGRGEVRRTRRHAPPPEVQLRHGETSLEGRDALRRLAGAEVRARQRSLDARLAAQFGEGCR